METAYAANSKKSGNAINNLRKALDLQRLIFEWKKEAKGIFGLMVS